MKTKPAVLIADDHPLVKLGLVQLLTEEGYDIVAHYSDGASALIGIRELKPALALLDNAMPGLTGLQVAATVTQERSETRIVLIAASLDGADINKALENGVRGIVLKEHAAEELVMALRAVLRGERWLSRDVRDMRARALEANGQFGNPLLTSRECTIVRLVSDGHSNKSLGRELGLAEGTVKVHLHNIYRKLNVGSRTELIVMFRRNESGHFFKDKP